MKSKKIIIPAIALGALSLVSVLGVSSVRADENSTLHPVAQRLAERFNLNVDEVDQVFGEEREERQQQMQVRFEERLDESLNDGKITEEQRQAIIAKRDEMRGEREEFRGQMSEERQENREVHREEMESWAEENGIDLDSLPELLGGGPRGGFGKHADR